jgi:hypothetical protein
VRSKMSGLCWGNHQRKRLAVTSEIMESDTKICGEKSRIKGLDRYLRVLGELYASCWYRLLQWYQTISMFVMTVLRLLCDSYLVNRSRINVYSAPYDCHNFTPGACGKNASTLTFPKNLSVPNTPDSRSNTAGRGRRLLQDFRAIQF